MNTNELVTVTVTYHPELDLLRAQLEALPNNCLKVIVDNASTETARKSIRELRESIPNVHCVENSENIGLAAALNQGVRLGKKLCPDALWCLLLDQDSELQGNCLACRLCRSCFSGRKNRTHAWFSPNDSMALAAHISYSQ